MADRPDAANKKEQDHPSSHVLDQTKPPVPVTKTDDTSSLSRGGTAAPTAFEEGHERQAPKQKVGDKSNPRIIEFTPLTAAATEPPKPLSLDEQKRVDRINGAEIAIQKAEGGDDLAGQLRADFRAIPQIVQSLPSEDRKALADAYRENHDGRGELSKVLDGQVSESEAFRFKALFSESASDSPGKRAATQLMHDLIEKHEDKADSTRNPEIIEKDIRDIYRVLDKSQIAQMNSSFREQYGEYLKSHSSNLADRNSSAAQLAKDPLDVMQMANPFGREAKAAHSYEPADIRQALNKETIDTVKALSSGSREELNSDAQKRMGSALKAKDLDKFKEAAQDASPELRQNFLKNSGDSTLKNGSGTFNELALDYLKNGRLSEEALIRQNSGLLSNNLEAMQTVMQFYMTVEKRSAFIAGQKLDESLKTELKQNPSADGEKLMEGWTSQQREVFKTYGDLHSTLSKYCTPAQTLALESVVHHGGSTIVSDLAKTEGYLLKTQEPAVSAAIENMSKADWEYAKQHPELRKDVESMLTALGAGQLIKQYDEKIGPPAGDPSNRSPLDFEESKKFGTQPIIDKIWLHSGDPQQMLKDLSGMSRTEMFDSYNKNLQFKAELDRTLTMLLKPNPEALKSAREILDIAAHPGSSAELDRVQMKLAAIENIKDRDSKLIAINDALKHGYPNMDHYNDSDSFSKQGQQAIDKWLQKNLSADDYNSFGKSAGDNLKLPLDTLLAARAKQGDWQGALGDIANAGPKDQERLKTDPKLLEFMTPEQKELAAVISKQGQALPEDQMRMAVLSGADSKDLVKMVRDTDPAALSQISKDYAGKYSASYEANVLEYCNPADRIVVMNTFLQNRDLLEQYMSVKNEVGKASSGIWSSIFNNMDAGSKQLLDAMADESGRRLKAVNEAAVQKEPLGPKQEEARKAIEGTADSATNYLDRKKAMGEVSEQVGITLGSMAIAAIPGVNVVEATVLIGGFSAGMPLLTEIPSQGSYYDNRTAFGTYAGAIVRGETTLGAGVIAKGFGLEGPLIRDPIAGAVGSWSSAAIRTAIDWKAERSNQDNISRILSNADQDAFLGFGTGIGGGVMGKLAFGTSSGILKVPVFAATVAGRATLKPLLSREGTPLTTDSMTDKISAPTPPYRAPSRD